jgi:hypothetical protein
MIEMTHKLSKGLVRAAPIIPGPIGTAVAVLQVALVACTLIGAIGAEVKKWDWPWSS